MILRALYDYYKRSDNLPAKGMEEKEIGFLIVLSPEGRFLRFEDCRLEKDRARIYLVKKHVGRSSAAVANYLYDNSAYVLGYSDKTNGKEQLYFDTFKEKVETIAKVFLYEGRMIAFTGVIIGTVLGVALCMAQQHFGLIKMGNEAGSFIIDAYPVSVRWGDVVLTFFTVMIAGYISTWYPVRYLSKKLL